MNRIIITVIMVKCNHSTCRSLILIFIDFVCKMSKNYYTSVYLDGCKYFVRKKEMTRQITENYKLFVMGLIIKL